MLHDGQVITSSTGSSQVKINHVNLENPAILSK